MDFFKGFWIKCATRNSVSNTLVNSVSFTVFQFKRKPFILKKLDRSVFRHLSDVARPTKGSGMGIFVYLSMFCWNVAVVNVTLYFTDH